MGNRLIFLYHSQLKADALGTIEPRFRVVESRKSVEAVTARSGRSLKQRKSMLPRAREKAMRVIVPRSDTGAQAEKAKACRDNRR